MSVMPEYLRELLNRGCTVKWDENSVTVGCFNQVKGDGKRALEAVLFLVKAVKERYMTFDVSDIGIRWDITIFLKPQIPDPD